MIKLALLGIATWVLASWAYRDRVKGVWLAVSSTLGCILAGAISLIPGSMVFGGHFEGAWFIFVFLAALACGWGIGLAIPIVVFRRRSAVQTQPSPGIDRASDD